MGSGRYTLIIIIEDAILTVLSAFQEPFSTPIPENGRFEGKLPGWGTGKLVALVSAEVLSTKKIDLAGGGITLLGTPQTSYQQLTLRNGSLTEWTEKVSSSGHVSLQLATSKSTTYRLFAFYEFLSHEKNLDYASDQPKTIFDNGSYAVDHFSARGAQTTIKFWEKHILTDNVRALLKEVGNYGRLRIHRSALLLILIFEQDGKTAWRFDPISPGRHLFHKFSSPFMVTT